jgi:hypothetical protein
LHTQAFSSHCIVFLATLGIMCHLSLGVWKNSLSFCLFVLYVFVKTKFAMLLIGHDLHCNYGLHIIGVLNLFEHCISLEIPLFDSCVRLVRLYLFYFFHMHTNIVSVRYEN